MFMAERTIEIPQGVDVSVEGFKVAVGGSLGKVEKDFSSPLFRNEVKIKKDGNKITVSCDSTKRKIKSVAGTIESHINNMISGVIKGYTYKLKIVFMHFPMTVKAAGKEIIVQNFLGEKSSRKAEITGDVKVVIKDDDITVTGYNKEDVGQTAANIERATKISARDRRVFQDGIFLVSSE